MGLGGLRPLRVVFVQGRVLPGFAGGVVGFHAPLAAMGGGEAVRDREQAARFPQERVGAPRAVLLGARSRGGGAAMGGETVCLVEPAAGCRS